MARSPILAAVHDVGDGGADGSSSNGGAPSPIIPKEERRSGGRGVGGGDGIGGRRTRKEEGHRGVRQAAMTKKQTKCHICQTQTHMHCHKLGKTLVYDASMTLLHKQQQKQ